MTGDLFSNANLARTVAIPSAPQLDTERYAAWPYPGMTAEDCARKAISMSPEYADMLEAVIRSQGEAVLTSDQIKALIPQDWRDLMGCWLYGGMCARVAERRGIQATYVSHDGKGFHFSYRVAP